MLDQATTTWQCECGRANVSVGCPRCGATRSAGGHLTPPNPLPRRQPARATRSDPSPSPAFGPPPVALPRQTSWSEDLGFALTKPFSPMGLIMMGSCAVLALIANLPIFVCNIVAFIALFWVSNNYFFKAIQSASSGREELPDSPGGYEAMGVFRLIWTLLCTYFGLLAPVFFSLVALLALPALRAFTIPILVASFVWPVAAYPMTLLLTAHTLNPVASWNYWAIFGSMARTASSYGRVLAFFVALELPPIVIRFIVSPETASGASLAVTALSTAWTTYTMIALALLLGRFYRREKKALGWFSA